MVAVARPRFSVIIPTFDRAQAVPVAVDSVLAQDYPEVEVVVVDDGSADGTWDLLARRYGGDARVRRARQANLGTASARNLGIGLATGDLIAFLDSDDRLLPGHLAAQEARLAAHPGAGMSLCDARYEGGDPGDERTAFGRQRRLPTSLRDMCLGGWMLITCATFRAPVIRELRFDPAWHAEDTELWMRFFAAGHTYVVEPSVRTVYRRHDGAAGAPQKSADPVRGRLEGLRLATAYRDQVERPAAVTLRIHRASAKLLTALGRDREARRHLLAWWLRRPFALRPLHLLLLGFLRDALGRTRRDARVRVPALRPREAAPPAGKGRQRAGPTPSGS
jgi:glycosyltransferase involved in cell wall biosynthesis